MQGDKYFVLVVSYPHDYRGDMVLQYRDEAERDEALAEYVELNAGRRWGQDGFMALSVGTLAGVN